jgi:drug/metabolite transporter (DMT)-like permease
MLAANLGLLFCAFSWGSLIPGLNYLLRNWDPYFLAAARYALAAPLLLVFLRLAEGEMPWLAGLPAWRWWLLGAIGIGMFASLYTLGLQHANPIVVAILSSASPVVTAIVGRLAFNLPIPRRMLPGIVLTIAGCVYATYDPQLPGSPFDLRGGEILVIVAQACWSWYSIASQRWMRGCSQLRIAGITTLTGSVTLILIYLSAGALGAADLPPARPQDVTQVAVFVWAPLVPVLLGNILWLHGVRKLGPMIAALFMNLIPVSAVLVAAALGIEPTPQQLVGGAVVMGGILLAQLRWR